MPANGTKQCLDHALALPADVGWLSIQVTGQGNYTMDQVAFEQHRAEIQTDPDGGGMALLTYRFSGGNLAAE
jgi:hypothetical protein